MKRRFPQTVLATVCVPWDARQRFMEDPFRQQLRALQVAGIEDIYIFGTAGEGYAVDTARFRDVTQLFYDLTEGKTARPEVGVIALSTANCIERIAMAYEIGFRIFQISLPCWGALNDQELMTFFHDVCSTFPDSRFVHYDLDRVKRRLCAEDYARICDAEPNVVAAKITGRDLDKAISIMRQAPQLQPFFTEPLFAKASRYGACSQLSAYAPLSPALAWRYFEAGRDKRLETLDTLADRYQQLGQFLSEAIGPERHMDGVYDKIIARLGKHEMPLRLLSPYQSATEAEYLECERVYRERFAHWFNDVNDTIASEKAS